MVIGLIVAGALWVFKSCTLAFHDWIPQDVVDAQVDIAWQSDGGLRITNRMPNRDLRYVELEVKFRTKSSYGDWEPTEEELEGNVFIPANTSAVLTGYGHVGSDSQFDPIAAVIARCSDQWPDLDWDADSDESLHESPSRRLSWEIDASGSGVDFRLVAPRTITGASVRFIYRRGPAVYEENAAKSGLLLKSGEETVISASLSGTGMFELDMSNVRGLPIKIMRVFVSYEDD